jgi:hypothetical protein
MVPTLLALKWKKRKGKKEERQNRKGGEGREGGKKEKQGRERKKGENQAHLTYFCIGIRSLHVAQNTFAIGNEKI